MKRLAIAALAGCLSTPPRPNRQPNTDGCLARAQAICDTRVRCSDGYDIQRLYGDEATCVTRVAAPCIDDSQILNTGETADRVAQCTTEYASMSCAVFQDDDLSGACATPAGPGDIGSPCATGSECKSAFCATTSTSVCGTCQPIPNIGDPCDAQFECGHALTCAISSNTCQPRVPKDAPCLTGYVPCGAGLTCMKEDLTAMTMGTCQPAALENETCDPLHFSAPGCDGGFGLTCITATHTCQVNKIANPGDACGSMGSPTTEVWVCGAGGLCVKAAGARNGICVAAAADGDPCDNDPTIGPPCLDPARCVPTGDGTAGICTIPDARMCN